MNPSQLLNMFVMYRSRQYSNFGDLFAFFIVTLFYLINFTDRHKSSQRFN